MQAGGRAGRQARRRRQPAPVRVQLEATRLARRAGSGIHLFSTRGRPVGAARRLGRRALEVMREAGELASSVADFIEINHLLSRGVAVKINTAGGIHVGGASVWR